MVGGGVDGLGGGAPRPSSLGPPAAAVAMAPAVTPLSSMSRLSAPLSASPVSSALSIFVYSSYVFLSIYVAVSLENLSDSYWICAVSRQFVFSCILSKNAFDKLIRLPAAGFVQLYIMCILNFW